MFRRYYIGVEWKNWLIEGREWEVVRDIIGEDGKDWSALNGKGFFGEESEVLWDWVGWE